jgi:uncharacterized protein with ParB-like and HNH nuclease domain
VQAIVEHHKVNYVQRDGLQLNPDFQRGHVWNEQQQIDFIENLLQGGAINGRLIILNWPYPYEPNPYNGEYNDFVLIDGLQRLTALERFWNNEIQVFGYYKKEYTGYIPLCISMGIQICNLKTKKEVLQLYLEINDTGVHHTPEELNRVKQLMQQC